MVALATARLAWNARNVRGDFFESADKRFDVYFAEWSGEWVAHDWQEGLTVRGSRERCERWCAARAVEFPTPEAVS